MNSKIYRQADSRWGSLPYPTKAYSFAGNGCGCCACVHNIIEIPKYANYTPIDVRPYMVSQGFATKGHGTTWAGITKTLQHYGFSVSEPNINSSMTGAWNLLNKAGAPKQGVLLFRGGTKGGITWTTGGHYVAFLSYKVENGKHYFYTKDSGGRKHDGWYCYETQMRGLLPKIYIVTAAPSGTGTVTSTTTTTTTYKTPSGNYTGALPTSTIKKGSKGTAVKNWQKFLNWFGGYGLTTDGIFGAGTQNATKKFQSVKGLTPDGIVGSKTIAKAKAYTSQTSSSTTTTTTLPTGKYSGTIPSPIIKKGSKGTKAKNLQKFLNWFGNYGLTTDGVFGTKSVAALKKFQKAVGLKDDGVYGKNSQAKAKTFASTPAPSPTPTPTPTPTNNKCIDVSYWQGKISVDNWKKIKKTCSYAICRSSYTSQSKFSLGTDSTFATNYQNAMAAGLKVGVYHYSQAISTSEAKKEAQYMCDIIKKYPKPTFYVVCDFEYGKRLNSKIGKKASDIANAFCDVVKANGYQPCIYANTSTLNSNLTNPKYPVWVAQYASSCTYKKDKVMWQYTSSGKVDGISAKNTNSGSSKVDLSYVYKDFPINSGTTTTTTTQQDDTQNNPVSNTAKLYNGTLPNLHVTKSSSQVISDALKWGKWIAGNNTFHYGEYGKKAYVDKSSKYYAGGKYVDIYNVTHSCGCHFCGTEGKKKVNKANKLGYNGANWEYTYVCNTFATAIYAHGGMESTAMDKCRNASVFGFDDKGRSSALDKSKNWTYKGKLAIKDLKAGDILISASHMQIVYAPVSSSKVKIIEATSYFGKYHSKASDNSIRIIEKAPSYKAVYRFTGKVDADIPIRYGEYSDRVELWQQFLNWAGFNCGDADGKFDVKTLAATKDFQIKYGLEADGIIGAKTLEKSKTFK